MKQVIPVVVINDEKETIEILSKLREGGINCAEITFRTACAKEAIAIGTKAFEDMNIGAGTVINAEQAKSAVQAGAKFIVSPGFSDEVARYCTDEKIPYYPGCVTPTEIMRALSYGLNVVKFSRRRIWRSESDESIVGAVPAGQIYTDWRCGFEQFERIP